MFNSSPITTWDGATVFGTFADSGQPWENTMGWPEPQSLKKIWTLSLVVKVLIVRSPITAS